MRVDVALDIPGLEEKLAEFLPAGVRPTAVHVAQDRLRIEGRAPLGVAVALTARIDAAPGRLTLSDFDVEGAGFLKSTVLSQIRRKAAELHVSRSGFRARGEDEGRAVVVSWD
jgi:hypothetical protein